MIRDGTVVALPSEFMRLEQVLEFVDIEGVVVAVVVVPRRSFRSSTSSTWRRLWLEQVLEFVDIEGVIVVPRSSIAVVKLLPTPPKG